MRRSPFWVPLWVVFCACLRSGRHVLWWRRPHGATRDAASRHTTTNLQLAPPVSVPTKTHQHSREGHSKIETIERRGPCRGLPFFHDVATVTFSLVLRCSSFDSLSNLNKLAVRGQSLDWPLWSGHSPTSSAGTLRFERASRRRVC